MSKILINTISIVQDVRSYLSLPPPRICETVGSSQRSTRRWHNSALHRSQTWRRKKVERKTPFLSLLSNDFSSLVTFLCVICAPAHERSNWSTVWSTYFLSRSRSLIDPKLSSAFFATRDMIFSSLCLLVSICLVYFYLALSFCLSLLLSFSR